jgi:hypothetical protein
MAARKNEPAIIDALEPKAHFVRQVASELGFLYDEGPVAGKEGLVRFSLRQMDVPAIVRLVAAMPREV